MAVVPEVVAAKQCGRWRSCFRFRLSRFFRNPAGNRDAHPDFEIPQADGNHPPVGITVISIEEFAAWKRGEREIPEKSILLTFDDGWKSVYTDAFPILKEFGYPFTLYLYKNYVDGGGKALTTPMIQEMIKAGATIGSHSISHPYPITVKSFRKKGPDAYDAYLRKEMGESKRFLESKFPVKATTYSYPGGFYTEEMIPLGKEFGYTYLFTVQPGKVKRSMADETLPRYMILGNYDKIFEFATTFRECAKRRIGS